MVSRHYKFNNSTLTIIFGDIMESKSEVIVSSDDTGISMGGGISGCILREGGEFIRKDAQKKLPAQLGDVVVSSAGNLQYQKYIFHCLTIPQERKTDFYEGRLTNADDMNNYILNHSVDKCFRLLQALDLKSIAFPCIGAGLAHIPLQKVAEVMAEVISNNLCQTQKEYKVELYLFDRNHALTEMDYIDMFENFAVKSALAKYKNREQYKSNDNQAKDLNIEIPLRADMKHKVFISYSRKDSNSVDKVKNILDKYKLPYWIDKDGIFSGENYKEVIVDAIDVAKVVLFVSSENSNSSIHVIRELGYAVQQQKTIIPIILDDTQYAKSIRLDIADIDKIDFKDIEISDKKLIASLAYSLEL